MAGTEGPPLTPSAGQAANLLRQELAKQEYQQHKGLLQTVLDWLGEQLGRLLDGAGGTVPAIAWLVGILLVILLVVVAAISLRRGRVHPRSTSEDAVLGEHAMTASDLRRRAGNAERAGDFQGATLDYFRALAVRGVERALVDPAPGLTAYDIARVLGGRFPDRAGDVAAAATIFDAVLYGDQPADAAACARMRELELDVQRARPAPAAGSFTGSGSNG